MITLLGHCRFFPFSFYQVHESLHGLYLDLIIERFNVTRLVGQSYIIDTKGFKASLPNLILRSRRSWRFPPYPSNLCQSYYVSAKLPSCPFFSSTIVTVRRVGWEMVSFHGRRTLTFHQGFVCHVANSKKRKFILLFFLDNIENDLWNSIIVM